MTTPAAPAFPLAPDEGARVAALAEYDMFERGADGAFEELTALAARLCGTSLSYVSLVGERAVWLTAARGRPSFAAPREHAYCAHAAFAHEILVVPDSASDPRFSESPFARGDGALRFYAGVPLASPEGHRVGVLCVLDQAPREQLPPDQQELLRALGRQATALLQGRLAVRRQRAAIEERDAREAALRASEARFRRLSEVTTDGIAISQGGRLVAVNGSFCRIFGVPESAAIGLEPLDFVSPDSRPLVRKWVGSGGGIEGSYEAVGVRADGTHFPIEVWSRGMDLDGRPGRVAMIRDISERREVDRLKSEFVSVVSHELRTPLTSIRGALGLLEAGSVGTLPAAASELTRIARTNADRLIRLIDNILDLERMAAGELELRVVALGTRELLDEAVRGVAASAAPRRVRLRVDAEHAPPQLVGDRDRLLQVLTNLLSNAVKFSPEGGEVVVRAETAARSVRVAVSDHGPGIAPEQICRLFQPFGQLDGSDDRAQGGTGLGLAIARSLVERHGGSLGVESEPGVRTTFWFQLPAPTPGGGARDG